jgi:glycosyltransferase involved in cell wall biosynthesis
MKRKPKIIVVMPAHNAAKTLKTSYKRLPKEYVDEVILIDDASTDNTYKIAKQLPIKVFRNEINLGYGGNLKMCLTKALEAGADIIIEFHPDNQYDPQNLPLFLEKAKIGYDFALGSRFIHPKEALERHMPLTKFIANRSLTFIDQFILGIELSEFHSGFRLYTRTFLQSVPYLQNSDDYLFSFEIIVQAVYYKFKVADVQISCDYHPKMHTANLYRSTIYALGTFQTLFQYVLSKFGKHPLGPFKKVSQYSCYLCKKVITRKEYDVQDAVKGEKFSIYFCIPCQIGFTNAPPKNLSPYYPKTYYSGIKTFIYRLLQNRRIQFIKSLIKGGKILDIGCAEGYISNQLGSQYHYIGIEPPFSGVKNPLVKLVGIENMKEKSNSYNMVTFWESFEHLRNPTEALKKAYRALVKNGYLIIECPNYASWEKLPFSSRWFHLDPPRHLFHFTPAGLKAQLEKTGFKVISQKIIFAPEYIPVGLAQSILYRISPRLNVFAQKYNNKSAFIIPFVIASLALILFPISYVFYLLKGSPIQLIIGEK